MKLLEKKQEVQISEKEKQDKVAENPSFKKGSRS
jgi:hypothetical protein